VPLQRRTVDAQLPDSAAHPGPDAPAIVLEVGPGSTYRVNRQPVAPMGLHAHLEGIYRGRPDRTLLVRGDRAASYQEVITAMDVARGAGVRVIGLPTR
jgi:biopolymer transport protein ExbD